MDLLQSTYQVTVSVNHSNEATFVKILSNTLDTANLASSDPIGLPDMSATFNMVNNYILLHWCEYGSICWLQHMALECA